MPSSPRVRIVSTGSEILQGLYADTNAQKLSRLLMDRGLRVVGHAAAPDEPELIEEAIRQAMAGSDLVVTTGGLGPTEDDVNREIIARLYNVGLHRDGVAERMMRRRFLLRGMVMPARNVIQAMMPDGAAVLYNHWGTAPGFVLPGGSATPPLMALPGPPNEWQPMFQAAWRRVLPRLFPGLPIRRLHTLHIAMIPESTINEAIADLFHGNPGTELTILAARGHIRLRIVAEAESEEEAQSRVQALRARLLARLGPDLVYAEGPEAVGIESAVLDLLRGRGARLATAESCTGGWIAKILTDIAGSSDVYARGWVTYSNEAKIEELGVDPALLAEHGAVSAPVAVAMAEGARRRAAVDYAVAVTGVAGPGGGTVEKPVGTVWFAVAGPHGTFSRVRRFPGNRDGVREWSVRQALELLRRVVLQLDPDQPLFGKETGTGRAQTG